MALLQIGRRRPVPQKLRDRVYLSVSSEGYGHSSRALAIAGQFDPDEILIGTYSYALDRVASYGYPTAKVSQELKFIGSGGSFDVGKTILHNPARALGFNQIVQEEIEVIRENGVSLVVADGRMAPVLAASRLDVPCLVLTNQSAFYPFFARESELVKVFGRSFEWVMKLWLCSAEEILIPDFPPPDTVCLPNLSENRQVKKRTRFVGPLVAWTRDEIEPIERDPARPLVVVSTGGHAYRRPLFDAVLHVAKRFSGMDFIVLSSFEVDWLPENVRLERRVQNCAPYFKAADVNITQAGHSTAMELLTLGKPSIIVPDTNQIEQENNARRMHELGVCETLTYDRLEADLAGAVETVLNASGYRDSAERLAEQAADIHGAANTAQVLREYACRLIAY